MCNMEAPNDNAFVNTLAVGDDALTAGHRVADWAALWRAVDERIKERQPSTTVRVVELNVGLRGSRNGLAAAEEVVTRLRGVAGCSAVRRAARAARASCRFSGGAASRAPARGMQWASQMWRGLREAIVASPTP